MEASSACSSGGGGGDDAAAAPRATRCSYDGNYFRYKPWYFQPPSIILAGIGIIAGSDIFSNYNLEDTLLAAAIVLALWWFLLMVVPSTFRKFVDAKNVDAGLN